MFKLCSRIVKYNANKSIIVRNVSRASGSVALHDCNVNKYAKNFGPNNYNERPKFEIFGCALALSILGWLGFVEEDEDKESELIMTLKRSILAQQREQYDKAEQLMHLALRIAQQTQNEQGVIYCYDLMANLALERVELDKAEKLFVTVLQMLFSSGIKEDDLKVIHISLKLARIYHLKAEEEKAEIGYKWCLQQIQNKKDESLDAKGLFGVIQDWYAQYLLDRGDVKTSLSHLKEAYEISREIKGYITDQNMLLLNDLAITSWRAGDLDGALNFLHEAIGISKALEDQTHVGVVHANLGLIYLEKGLKSEAEKYCRTALNLGRRAENAESVEQANYCFERIKISSANK